jgi:hypothetical protein
LALHAAAALSERGYDVEALVVYEASDTSLLPASDAAGSDASAFWQAMSEVRLPSRRDESMSDRRRALPDPSPPRRPPVPFARAAPRRRRPRRAHANVLRVLVWRGRGGRARRAAEATAPARDDAVRRGGGRRRPSGR